MFNKFIDRLKATATDSYQAIDFEDMPLNYDPNEDSAIAESNLAEIHADD